CTACRPTRPLRTSRVSLAPAQAPGQAGKSRRPHRGRRATVGRRPPAAQLAGRENPLRRAGFVDLSGIRSGRPDLNWGPQRPERCALTRLRYAPQATFDCSRGGRPGAKPLAHLGRLPSARRRAGAPPGRPNDRGTLLAAAGWLQAPLAARKPPRVLPLDLRDTVCAPPRRA